MGAIKRLRVSSSNKHISSTTQAQLRSFIRQCPKAGYLSEYAEDKQPLLDSKVMTLTIAYGFLKPVRIRKILSNRDNIRDAVLKTP